MIDLNLNSNLNFKIFLAHVVDMFSISMWCEACVESQNPLEVDRNVLTGNTRCS